VTAEKVEIVEANAETYGLNVTLDAIGLPKSTWYYWKNQKVDYEEKYAHLRQPLIEVLKENPAYGSDASSLTSRNSATRSERR